MTANEIDEKRNQKAAQVLVDNLKKLGKPSNVSCNELAANLSTEQIDVIFEHQDMYGNQEDWWSKTFCKKYVAPEGHKCCSKCAFFRVGRMPNRKCMIYPEQHMWFDAEMEIEENSDGKTDADKCVSYSEDKTLGYFTIEDIDKIIAERKRLKELKNDS